MRAQSRVAVAIAALLFASGANAEGKQIALDTTVEREIRFVNENGEEEVKRIPAEKVMPGETVIYTITARNVGTHPATNVVITDPIPEHMDYRAESASGEETSITFSIDNGHTYDVADALLIRNEDGTARPATAEEYTHIRWVFNDALVPGSSRTVWFRARLQ